MKFPSWLYVYGDQSYRGECPSETVEQATFFNRLRAQYPKTYGAIGLHIKNEGKRDFRQVAKMRAEGGFIPGASDVIIPGNPTFVLEIKRKNHMLSSWQKGQIEYLKAAQECGAYVSVALGHEAAWEAFNDWLENGRG